MESKLEQAKAEFVKAHRKVCACSGNCACKTKNKITKDMKIVDIIEKKPEAAELFFESGLGCAGCAFSGFESLEQGVLGHGMTEEDVEIILKRLNS